MVYKIYQVAEVDENFPDPQHLRVFQLTSKKLVLLQFRDKDNIFDTMEDAEHFIVGNEDFYRYSELTILPSVKSR